MGLSGASLGHKNIMAGVCIEMDKCKKQMIKGVNCFERKIQQDPSLHVQDFQKLKMLLDELV